MCELGRIADTLADKTPSPFEWAQFWVTLLSALGTLVVGALAAYIAYRSHQLSKNAQLDSTARRREAARRSFNDEAVATIDRLAEAALSGDFDAGYGAGTKVQNLIVRATASKDNTQFELATAVSEFADRLNKLAEQGQLALWGRGEVSAIKTRITIWLVNPDLYDEIPSEFWEQIAKKSPDKTARAEPTEAAD